MKKRIRLDNDKVRKLVNERLKKDGTFVHDTKIDKAIAQYLRERQENVNNDETESTMSFTKESKNTFHDMMVGLNEIIEDLRIIQTKESDVLIDVHPEELYAETYLEELIYTLESVANSIELLHDLNDNMGPE
jgi:hypothetical protein